MNLVSFTSGPIFTNGVVLWCTKTKKAAIIDAPHGCKKIVDDIVKKNDLQVAMLLLTHSHWDHVGDVAALKKTYRCPVYVHPLDAEGVRRPNTMGIGQFGETEGIEPDEELADGQVIPLGGLKLQVIHTPGHSQGGVCFYLKEENLLLAGDTLFKGSIGRIDLPTSQPEKMWSSLEKLKNLPAETRVLSGHGEETTIGEEPWLANAKDYFGG